MNEAERLLRELVGALHWLRCTNISIQNLVQFVNAEKFLARNEPDCTDGSSEGKDVEQIEDELEKELGWRWTPQMRHAYKMEKLWHKLIKARLALKEQSDVGTTPNKHCTMPATLEEGSCCCVTGCASAAALVVKWGW